MNGSFPLTKQIITLLSLILLIGMSACSSTKSVSYRSKKKRSTKKRTEVVLVEKNQADKTVELNPAREKVVHYASRFLYKPYRYGGQDPSGFDCSGFTSFVYSNYGMNIGRTSNMQSKKGHKVQVNQVKAGDLMFFGSGNKVSHVAIVYERTEHQLKIIHATSSKGVIISHYTDSEYWTQRFLYAKDVISQADTDFAFR